jgi:hypothetical protein
MYLKMFSNSWQSLLAVSCLLLGFALAPGADARDSIEAIDVKMAAAKDSSIDVVEKIYVNFDRPRQGIVRVIPLKFTRPGGTYTVDFHLNSVKDENNHAVSAAIERKSGEVVLDIGKDENAIKGQHGYTVAYTLRRAASHLDDQPEFFWPVSGYSWSEPINQASLTFKLPAGVNAADAVIEPQLGPPGAPAGGKVTSKQVGDEVYVQGFNIQPGEGLAVAIKLPKGTMVKPKLTSIIGWFLLDWYPAFLLPLVTIFGLFATWYHLGRDEDEGAPSGILSEPPAELSPAEMGVIVDERADNKDIVSIVLDMATRGYFNVVEVDKAGSGSERDYRFERTAKELGPELKPFETTLMRALFKRDTDNSQKRVTLSEIKYDPAMSMGRFRDLLYGGMAERGWFKQNVEVVRASYMRIGGLVIVLGGFLMVTAASTNVLPVAIGAFLSGVSILLFGRAMPARTLEGVRLRRKSLAFARFLGNADKASLKALADKNAHLFESYLPYAVVLNAQDKWAQAFSDDDALFVPPRWLQAADNGTAPGSTAATARLVEALVGAMEMLPSA